MKVVILTDTFLPYAGGGQIFVWEAVRRLCQKTDVDIEIVTRRLVIDGKKVIDNENYFKNRLRIVRLGVAAKWNNIFSRLGFILQATFYLLFQKFDLIDAQAFVAAVPGKIVALIKRKPVILTIHGTTLETGQASFFEKIILTKIKYDAQISAASNFLKFPNVNKNIFTVNPGVNGDFFKPDFSKKEKDRILFVGRLQKVKGTENLLRCADSLKQEQVKFVVVGDGEERERMADYARAHNLTNVEFVGELDKNQVLAEYQKASIFLLPSLSEGFPLTVLEAMSCGLPVVASNVGDVGKIIKNGVNGFVVEPQDAQGVVKWIKYLLKNESAREKIVENNLNAARHYSWEKTAAQIDKIYHKYD